MSNVDANSLRHQSLDANSTYPHSIGALPSFSCCGETKSAINMSSVELCCAVSIAGDEIEKEQPRDPGKQACPTTRIQELEALRVEYRVAWPLSIIVDSAALTHYNSLLIFLLQVSA